MKIKTKNTTTTLAILSGALLCQSTFAAEIDVKITNLTQGIYFTPVIIAAHTSDASIYTLGSAASDELQMMAEGGDISGLSTALTTASADILENPAGGLLAPGMSTEGMLSTADTNMYLSLGSMLLPTNDGFVGLDSWMIPTEAGTYTVYLNGYDAGTEANDEIINGGGMPGAAGIPVDPGAANGTGAMGVTDMENNEMVHVHRGVIGDTDVAGGYSDLDSTVHRWLNPVAMLTVTVK
ncbi:spondin domain-containing protein [uncultured Psychrosphaera sp.]|uniref:spondin domain-containing protein n=1 Tax=uncultured Psychrosphaera sp. TaxID=1403522 RepID=UPI0030F6036D